MSISVLSLFHPPLVTLTAAPGAMLKVNSLESSTLAFKAGDSEAVVRSTSPITISIPGKISRAYPAPVRLQSRAGTVEVLIDVDLETAVAWAVAAESVPGAQLEARKAMAVVARSWYTAARGRHSGFDFCDTTHCQFLGDAKARAATVKSTQGAVILFGGKAVEAMHSGDCGGRTKALSAVGLHADGYPFYGVKCAVPGMAWRRMLTAQEAAQLRAAPHSENVRIALCRRGGWDRVPSNEYVLEGLILEGRGRGHGVGMCQEGAAKMAAEGAGFLAILRHYFPNTSVGPMH